MSRFLPTLLLCIACNAPTTSPSESDGMQLQVVRLQHVLAEQVAEALTQRLPGEPTPTHGMRVAVEAEQNAVVLRGTKAQIDEALAIVARLDVVAGR